MKKIAILATLIIANGSQAMFGEVPFDPPGTYSTSWLGNTYMDMNGRRNVTESLDDVCVSPDGHVFSAAMQKLGAVALHTMHPTVVLSPGTTGLNRVLATRLNQ